MENVRLQKYLANCGICSRRNAEKLILDGKVSINGKVVTELGTKITPELDKVTCEGKEVKKQDSYVYILLNKPKAL